MDLVIGRPADHPHLPTEFGEEDVIWPVFSALNLIAIYWFADWETIPFHFIWISLTLLYGFRSWPTGPTMWILGVVMLTTASGIGLDVWRGFQS